MRVMDWIRGTVAGLKPGTIDIVTYREDGESKIALEAFALLTAVEMIARLLAKCEFKTYKNGKEVKGAEWVALNVKPNKNQTSTEFWQEVVCRLLFHNEVLWIVNPDGQKIIAESFNKTEYAVLETTFHDVERKEFVFSKTFRNSEVFYLRYNTIGKQAYMDSLFGMYESLISTASEKYYKSGGEKGILDISAKAQGDRKHEETFKTLMNDYFKSYFQQRNAVLPLHDGYSYKPSTSDAAKKYSNEISDINALVESALARAAQAFQIPPALLRGDVAGINDAYDVLLTNCIDPLAYMISEELTGKMFTADEIAVGCEIAADTSCIKHIDIFEIAPNADKLIACGLLSPDEVAEKAGLHPTGEEWAKKHYMTKNYTTAEETVKGGEKT